MVCSAILATAWLIVAYVPIFSHRYVIPRNNICAISKANTMFSRMSNLME